MYKVSQKYLDAMKRPVQRHRIKGTVGDVPFTEANILSGSFSITGQCSDTSNVQIGQVYISELKITLMKSVNLQRYSLMNAEISPFFGLRVDTGKYEYIPLGVFTVSKASWAASGVEITAYDNMSKLERSFGSSKLIGTPYEICTLACENCDLELGMTSADFQVFANGTMRLQLYADNDIETWRDVISWVAQTIGANAFADRAGRIVLKAYGQDVIDTLDTKHRFTGGTFDDYETRYTGISVVNIETQMTNYYGSEEDNGLTYNLGSNPFLQDIAEGTAEQVVMNILGALEQIKYVPFTVDMIGNPAYDLMDVFRFTDGLADGDKISCMTKYTFVYNAKYSMQGVGQNPALVSAKSKSDKNISGLMEQVKSITSSINNLIYDFNTGPLVVKQREQTLGMLTYYISQDADVEGHFLMNYTASESTHLTIRIYDQAVEELYSPIEIDIPEGEGHIGIPHAYLQRSVGIHGVYVTAQCLSGELHIDTRGVFFTIDAGNFAEAVDDISMDVRDITMRQLLSSNGPDQIWIVGLEDGKMLVSRRAYSESYNSNPEWEGVYTPGKAKDCAIEFDGKWVLRESSEKFTLETEDQPWYFWVDEEDKLIGQPGEDEGSRVVLDTGVSSVSACKGYSSNIYPDQDQGLVVAYIKSGKPYYRQYVYDPAQDKKRWLDSQKLLDEITEHLVVHRLNDYRISFELSTKTRNIWMYTRRTYVAQSYPKEIDTATCNENLAFLYAPADTDLSMNCSIEATADGMTFYVHINRPIRLYTDITSLISFDESSLPYDHIKGIKYESSTEKNESVITISLTKPSKTLITHVYINKTASNDLQYIIGQWGRVVFPATDLLVDTTVYVHQRYDEVFSMNCINSGLEFTKTTEKSVGDSENLGVMAESEILQIETGSRENQTEDVLGVSENTTIIYTQTGVSPI